MLIDWNEEKKGIILKIIALIGKEKKVDDFSINDGVEDLDIAKEFGLDSLDLIRFILDLEEEFGIKIPENELEYDKIVNLSYLCNYILQKKVSEEWSK